MTNDTKAWQQTTVTKKQLCDKIDELLITNVDCWPFARELWKRIEPLWQARAAHDKAQNDTKDCREAV